MKNTIQFYHKISEKFNVSPAVLNALIPENDQKTLVAIAAEIEKHEAQVDPYVKAIGKGKRLAWNESHYLHEVAALIKELKADANSYLEPVYKARTKRQADIENHRFLNDYRNAMVKFRVELKRVKRPKFYYPPGLAAFQPGLWCSLILPTKQQVNILAEKYVLEKVPDTLIKLVAWETFLKTRIMPVATYQVLGVPCLVWYFKIIILIEVRLRWVETEFTKEFQGYKYSYKLVSCNI
jgi:hypothetical protein